MTLKDGGNTAGLFKDLTYGWSVANTVGRVVIEALVSEDDGLAGGDF